ncbi:periplasmic heavy metal sensor [Phenylobacterium sp.]|uniref:periplasmic heavy metal sensor n=1 Tax=Phenylobacterium sp. TaxID=1871053 RepID=UPI0035AEB718
MSRRVLLIALFVSLAVNLFTVGAVVGGLVVAARTPPPQPAQEPRPGPAIWAAAQALGPEERLRFREMLREQGPAVNQRLHAVRQARREAWRMMGREPFDGRAVTGALDQARATEMQARGEVEHRIVEFASGLPPEERARFAQRLAPVDADGQALERRPRRPAVPPAGGAEP